MTVTDYSRDGAHVLFSNTGASSSFDIWDLALGSEPRARPIRRTSFEEYHGVFSPDGKLMAYVSDETGAPEVYVQSFPDGERREQVSSQGGTEPHWRADGRELYFLRADRMLMATPVSPQPVFKAGLPVPLFLTRVPVTANPYRRHYLASADGERFLVNTARADAPQPAIQVVLDWRVLLVAGGK